MIDFDFGDDENYVDDDDFWTRSTDEEAGDWFHKWMVQVHRREDRKEKIMRIYNDERTQNRD